MGDSLGLARQAAQTDAEVIVFCGVHFMAETAKILNPGKKVLLPDLDAGCSLSDSCPADKLAEYKEKNPDLYVVAYVNCSAAVKALSGVICTSGNAVQIVNSVPGQGNTLRAGSKSRTVGNRANRTTDAPLAGQLLRSRAFHQGIDRALQNRVPECPGGRSSRVY